MKNYKNRIVQGVIIMAVFVLGLLVGLEIGYKRIADPLDSMRTLLLVATQGEIAGTQYFNANYEEAKAALLNYVNFLDDLKSKGMVEKEKYLGPRTYYIDRGLSYARLALLEEKVGNTAEAKINMQEASKMFQMVGWKDYSETRIRYFLERLDQKYEYKNKQ